jgi:hypothetical protein
MTPQPELSPTPEPRKATGPTTPEGKARASLNALRHGLSGQTVLMPWEDQAAFKAHCDEIMASLAPVGKLETDCAQGIANDQWRLNRARAVDNNMFALGHFEQEPETGHPQIDAAIICARAFRDHSKTFVNLSLYEQRINRSLEKNFARFRTLQYDRELEEGMARGDASLRQVKADFEAAQARKSAHPSPAAQTHQRSGLIPTPSEAKPKTPGPEFDYSTLFSPAQKRLLEESGLDPDRAFARPKAA